MRLVRNSPLYNTDSLTRSIYLSICSLPHLLTHHARRSASRSTSKVPCWQQGVWTRQRSFGTLRAATSSSRCRWVSNEAASQHYHSNYYYDFLLLWFSLLSDSVEHNKQYLKKILYFDSWLSIAFNTPIYIYISLLYFLHINLKQPNIQTKQTNAGSYGWNYHCQLQLNRNPLADGLVRSHCRRVGHRDGETSAYPHRTSRRDFGGTVQFREQHHCDWVTW